MKHRIVRRAGLAILGIAVVVPLSAITGIAGGQPPRDGSSCWIGGQTYVDWYHYKGWTGFDLTWKNALDQQVGTTWSVSGLNANKPRGGGVATTPSGAVHYTFTGHLTDSDFTYTNACLVSG